MEGTTAVVLGATGGLGTEVARRLLGLCSTVVVHGLGHSEAARVAGQLSRLEPTTTVIGLGADFADLGATRDMVGLCNALPGGVDILVNVVDLLPPRARTVSVDGNEVTWQVNYLSPAMVVLGLLPALQASPAGRVVQVLRDPTGGLARTGTAEPGQMYRPAASYAEAKLALMMLSQTVAARVRGTPCRSLAIQPQRVHPDGGMTLSRGLMVDAVLYACTSQEVPNGGYLHGRTLSHPPKAVGGAPAQRHLWRVTCAELALDVRSGLPLQSPVR